MTMKVPIMEIDGRFIAISAVLILGWLLLLNALGAFEPTYDKNCPPAKECVCKINEKG